MSNKMIAKKIATPYAEALVQIGVNLYIETNSDIFYQLIFDIHEILDILRANPELMSFLKNPLNSAEQQKSILRKCLSPKTTSTTISFLNLLIDKKRINLLESICETFLEKAYKFLCVEFVEVFSPIELTAKQEEILRKKISTMLGPVFIAPYSQEPHLQLTINIDYRILGGLIIKVGSKVIDLSLRGELQRIAKELDIVL